jgi:hypothetical protein
MKTCLDCRESKDREAHFYRNKRKPDGFDIYCKSCCKERQHASHVKRSAKNPGLAARQSREWRAKNPEAARAYQRAWVAANPEKIEGYRFYDYWANRDKRLANDKARREANIDLFLARERASKARRLPQKLASVKAWQKSNPDKVRALASKRRAFIRERLPGWLTPEDFKAIEAFYTQAAQLQRDAGIEHHVDHILPLKGRYVSGLHVPSNLQVLTAQANLKKNNTWIPE